jgi:hypothetical protein
MAVLNSTSTCVSIDPLTERTAQSAARTTEAGFSASKVHLHHGEEATPAAEPLLRWSVASSCERCSSHAQADNHRCCAELRRDIFSADLVYSDCWGASDGVRHLARSGDIWRSLDDKHKDEIEVLSFSWGVANAGVVSAGSGGGSGKATFQDLSIVHNVDKASPLL